MKTFIVAREAYDRFSAGSISLESHRSESIEKLIVKLLNEQWGEDFTTEDTAVECFNEYNGDGADFFVIKELVKGELVEVPSISMPETNDD